MHEVVIVRVEANLRLKLLRRFDFSIARPERPLSIVNAVSEVEDQRHARLVN